MKRKKTPSRKIKQYSNARSTQSLEKNTWFSFPIFKFIGYISAIVGLILAYTPIKDFFLSPKQKYEKDAFVSGDLKPDPITAAPYTNELPDFSIGPINDSYPKIKGILIKDFDKKERIIVTASGMESIYPTKIFYKGVDIISTASLGCVKTKVILGVKDNRLYVSTEFKDLQREETIGIIEFNHWKLFKQNLLDFNNDDKRLEVKDKQNNIVFSLKYQLVNGVPTVDIQGYFIDKSNVFIWGHSISQPKSNILDCIFKTDPKWREKASDKISDISSFFP